MAFYEKFRSDQLIGAHRGWREIRPENTLCAFEAAAGHCDFIELDVQLSQDGAWVVCHDETLERTTDVEQCFPGELRPRRVIDYAVEELRRLDAGSWFLDRDPFGTLKSGRVWRETIQALMPIRLPTLEEVLDFSAASGISLNIEIKDMQTLPAKKVVRRFREVLEEYPKALPPILVSSLNHYYLAELSRGIPSLPLAALVNASHPPRLKDYLKRLWVEAYHVDTTLIKTTPIESLERLGIYCGVYTVNNPIHQEYLFRQGYRSIFSDCLIERDTPC
ncbi:glycerophosphodiester phosphodiesterase [Nitratifractor salsuginis]|uniref:Glycerophosphoryl diester phosphodiesterase n=1 Tax=Nitratifractor salsuginis (strain DSM 16511 / JCM 12458 / E9I37-1) TaxID=749222 RepID=E6X268_NITSE|nr:glycerophosphodiester phosphodiesterase family protein [Nitratifractor salsuginis]ADV47137.1 glycerophosphoryl diester phosphodiesterase [Nitratifractor salsuginis DSM 16511]